MSAHTKFRNFIWATLICLPISILLWGCNGGQQDAEQQTPSYNPYIEAFTSGTISRFSPVYIIFGEDIPESKLDTIALAKAFSIKPKIDGKLS